MFTAVEKPTLPRPSVREIMNDTGPQELGQAAVGLLFSSSGPLAVILAAAQAGSLSHAETSSWILGAFLGNGILTFFLTWLYRSPQAYFWTIPGTVIVGDALTHASFHEIIGAYLVTGVCVFLLGATGLIGRIMEALPAPIVMAMVAGIFLRFGLELVNATVKSPLIAAPMIITFVALSASARLSRMFPPVAAAAVCGTLIIILSGQLQGAVFTHGIVAQPVITLPQFSPPVLVELVVPLAITVVIVQNGQGTAVLRAAGHKQGTNLSAVASGLWSLPLAFLGTTSTCLTGPTNSILVSTKHKDRHYATALWCGVGAIIIGLFAPLFTSFMLALPTAFIASLAGVAMLTPLRNAFLAGFSGRHSFGSLACFCVTVSNINLVGISAPFWGLIVGCVFAALLDKESSYSATSASTNKK